MKQMIIFIFVVLMSIQLYAQGHGSHAPHLIIEGIKALTMSPSDLSGVRQIQAEQDARIRSMSNPHFNPKVPFYPKRKDSFKHVTPNVVKIHNSCLDSIKVKGICIPKTGNKKK